jgi:hypothetical protein
VIVSILSKNPTLKTHFKEQKKENRNLSTQIQNAYNFTPQHFHQPTGTASGLPDAVIELVTRPNLNERIGCDSRLHEIVIPLL